jgi:hypothetical protein
VCQPRRNWHRGSHFVRSSMASETGSFRQNRPPVVVTGGLAEPA